MNGSIQFGCALLVGLLLCSCSDDSDANTTDASVDGISCFEALDCADARCQKKVDGSTLCENAQGFERSVQQGTCGQYSFLRTGDPFGGTTTYFRDDTVVASEDQTDTNAFCGKSAFSRIRGDRHVVASCLDEVKAARNLCAATSQDAGSDAAADAATDDAGTVDGDD